MRNGGEGGKLFVCAVSDDDVSDRHGSKRDSDSLAVNLNSFKEASTLRYNELVTYSCASAIDGPVFRVNALSLTSLQPLHHTPGTFEARDPASMPRSTA